jgi:hypothetical protein
MRINESSDLESTTFRTYGAYIGDPTPEQLQAFFTLEPRVHALIREARYPHTRLGFAVQRCTRSGSGTLLR